MYRCALCEAPRAAVDLRTISSTFEYDPSEVSRVLDKEVQGTYGADTLTVCEGDCANRIRQNSAVIYSDEPFSPIG
jgi:hypothetical protein